MYCLLLCSTLITPKYGPNRNWVELGQELARQGYQVILPWGSEAEMKVSALIASQIPGAIVPRAFSIEEAYSLVAHAALTIGVDTGLTHLSAVLGKPTVEIYCDSPRWKTEGYWSKVIANLGDMKKPPTTDEVIEVARAVAAIQV